MRKNNAVEVTSNDLLDARWFMLLNVQNML